MREILFRGKTILENEWVIGAGVYKSEGHTWIITDDVTKTESRGTGSDAINPETVCQFTGLTDKNGTKIFDGDIVKVEGFLELAFVVIYYNGGFKLKEIGSEDLFAYYITETMVENELIDVIGNINDNPELLEG